MKYLKLICFLSLLYLGGCASTAVRTTVTAHGDLSSEKIDKKTFGIGKSNPFGLSELEINSFKRTLSTKLIEKGVKEAAQPDWVIDFDVSISKGEKTRVSEPIIGKTGVSSAYSSGVYNANSYGGSYSGTTTYVPSYGVIGSSEYDVILYTRTLRLRIFDRKSTKLIYENKGISTGESSTITAVFGPMLDAMLKDFPHKDGYSKSLEIRVLD